MSEDWTTENMPDLTGKVIIVTGANSGIGFEAVREFARKGATTVMACRNLTKAEAALAEIKREQPDADIVIRQLDLSSLSSVKSFVSAFKASYDKLDILVNNAGIMMVPYGETEDGFERQLGTNHMGHFALTGQLIDRLEAAPGSRVINISSNGHRMGDMDFANLMYEDGAGYSGSQAYGRSKLANLLFTYELQRRFDKAGIDAAALAAHPGGSNTNLANHLSHRWYFKLLMPIMERMMQSAEMGALPTLRAAVDPQAQGGDYYGPSRFMESVGYPVKVASSNLSHDEAVAKKLWDVSTELTGVKYLDD